MNDDSPQLDHAMMALAHPVRRAILDRLMNDGEARVTALAEPFDMSLNAVSKHIQILERANLVTRRREWREHVVSFNPTPLNDVAKWIETRKPKPVRKRKAKAKAKVKVKSKSRPKPKSKPSPRVKRDLTPTRKPARKAATKAAPPKPEPTVTPTPPTPTPAPTPEPQPQPSRPFDALDAFLKAERGDS